MRFFSKKNEVRLENGVVSKRYTCPTRLEREAVMLTALFASGLAVPELLGRSGDTLLLQYIKGSTYADLSDGITWPKAAALARWLAAYHRITGELRADVNLRNFLWTGSKCVGLDFEDPPARGQRETDQGKIIAFAVTYHPPFSQGKEAGACHLLRAFAQTGGDRNRIRSAYLSEISAIMERRNPAPFTLADAGAFFAAIEDRL